MRKNYINPQFAKELAIAFHEAHGCGYDGMPYEAHLSRVENSFHNFKYCLPEADVDFIHCAIWLHDVMEDCKVSYQLLKTEFGTRVAEAVYAVTNELGRNRGERLKKTLPKIQSNGDAIFIKLCDRIANTSYSKNTNSSMFDMYKSEYRIFKNSLRNCDDRFVPMWKYLDDLNDFTEKTRQCFVT